MSDSCRQNQQRRRCVAPELRLYLLENSYSGNNPPQSQLISQYPDVCGDVQGNHRHVPVALLLHPRLPDKLRFSHAKFYWRMADYASLQKLALSDKGQDEAVTVNQRALIGIPNLLHVHLLMRKTKSSLVTPLTTQHSESSCKTQMMLMLPPLKYII